MGQRLSALLGAIAIYTLIAAVMALLLAHIVAPATTRAANVIRAGIAADLVGRSLVPHRFAKVVEGRDHYGGRTQAQRRDHLVLRR